MKEKVRRILKPFHADLCSIPLEAWEKEKKTFRWFKRTKSDDVFDAMIILAINKFANKKNIRPHEKNGTVFFIIDNKIALRFKKGDEKGLSHNIQTALAIAFNNPQQEIPGFEDLIKIEVIHQFDSKFSTIIDVVVSQRDGDTILWHYPILEKANIADISNQAKQGQLDVDIDSHAKSNNKSNVRIKK